VILVTAASVPSLAGRDDDHYTMSCFFSGRLRTGLPVAA
jgi:hypothetical protein